MKKIGSSVLNWIRSLFMRGSYLRAWVVPLLLIAVVSGFTVSGINQLVDSFQYSRKELSGSSEDLGIDESLEIPEGITSVALFGVDSRDTAFSGLSDSIMIITVDAKHNKIKLVSVMRDSLVEIDGYGAQKINAAYNAGGAQLAVKTLNQVFKLNIRDYATVDFARMADIIDVVGGVEVELTEAEVRSANHNIEEMYYKMDTPADYIESSGRQTLNGIQAVAFARIRGVQTINGTRDDFGRTERQRLVMYQLFQKALNMEISRYPAVIKKILPMIETSLTYGEIFDLAGILASQGLTFDQARMPADEIIIDADYRPAGLGSCVYYDLNYAAKMMQAFVIEDISFADYIEANPVDLDGYDSGYGSGTGSGGTGSGGTASGSMSSGSGTGGTQQVSGSGSGNSSSPTSKPTTTVDTIEETDGSENPSDTTETGKTEETIPSEEEETPEESEIPTVTVPPVTTDEEIPEVIVPPVEEQPMGGITPDQEGETSPLPSET